MPSIIAEATAPTRIDLAGGTLDIWPLYLLHAGAVTVTVAIDRRAHCRVETGYDGVRLESKDTLAKAEGREVSSLVGAGELSLVACVLEALGIKTGVKVVTQSRVPAGSGLGGSSAVAVAVAAAAARALGRDLDGDALWPLVRDAETRAQGVPAGMQNHLAAIHGGVLAVRLEPSGVRAVRLATDPGRVEESLVLVDAGAAGPPGALDWEVVKRRIDGDVAVREALSEIATAAAGVREALVSHRYAEVGRLMNAEWEARKRLAPGVTSPEIDRIVEAARSCGGAAKPCGAGGGGMVAAWSAPGQRASLEAALGAAGFRPVAFRLDLRGLEVE